MSYGPRVYFEDRLDACIPKYMRIPAPRLRCAREHKYSAILVHGVLELNEKTYVINRAVRDVETIKLGPAKRGDAHVPASF